MKVHNILHWVNHTLTSWKHFFFASSNTQYCAKAMQEKCVNFFFCSCELSRKSEVRVTIWGLLSEISWEQRMLFCCAFGTKQNVTRKSIHSLTQCMKFCVRQTTTFHVIYLIILHTQNIRQGFDAHPSWSPVTNTKNENYK